MKTTLLPLLLALAAAAPAASPDTAPRSAPAAAPAAANAKRHPLRGVVTQIYPDRSALLVKHEEIPGVMRAMTMLFKVDAPTLAAARKGRALTGLMSRRGAEWILEDVKFPDGP